jgi:hypothetical protein
MNTDKRSTKIVLALAGFIRPLIDTTSSIKEMIVAFLLSDLPGLLESSSASVSEFVLATLDSLLPAAVHDFIVFTRSV